MSDIVTSSDAFLLPGLMPLKEFGRRVNRCSRTLKRWEDQGKLVVFALGNERLVDLEKTAARLRGEERRRSLRGG
jgi:predicted site-specific integrase-resolvase